MKDLINDEPEEEADSEDDLNRKRKGRDDSGSEDIEDDLDEDDYALLQDNLGEKFVPKKKKFKRVRRIADEDSDKEPEDAREAIANELFDGDDEPSTSRRDERRETDDITAGISSEESDDEDNFIVDDEGMPISRPRKRKGQHRYTDEAMQQAQDIFGVDFDFEEYLEEDEYEDEGDEEDYEDETEEGERVRKKKGGRRKATRKSIYEIYEPSELERSHLTEFDNEIKQTDLPERFLLRRTPVVETTDEALLKREAEWILRFAFSEPTITRQDFERGYAERTPLAGAKENAAQPKILEALKFIRSFSLEVPFIAFYRKEYVHPDLNINDLWTVYKWDEKFCQLDKRRKNMIQLFKNMQAYQADIIERSESGTAPEGMRLLSEDDIDMLYEHSNTFEELNDMWQYFQLYYSADIKPMKEEYLKREKERRQRERETKAAQNEDGEEQPPEDEEADEQLNKKLASLRLDRRKDFYTICKEAGITKMATKFGLTPVQLGENMREGYQKHEVVQEPVGPAEVALEFTCARFPTVEAVLSAARFAHAKQISCEPIVRATVRQEFLQNAVVQVRPTKKGLKERIDESHPCYTKKYLKNKRILDFSGDSFLQLLAAERDGLLDVKITLDKRDEPGELPYLKKVAGYYERDEYADNVQKWNTERNQVLELAFEKMLYPQFEKELKNRMRQEAIEAIIKKCAQKLNSWIRVAPYAVDPAIMEDEDFDTRDGVRVMGFAFLPVNDQAAFAAMIDGDGEVTDHLRLPNFMIRKGDRTSHADQQLRQKDHERLRTFILHKRPHVIVVGSETMTARNVHADITDIVQDLVDNEQFPAIHIEIVDNDLSTVYMNSKRAKQDFHDFPELLRQAISLARRIQDPLVEFSQLCTPDEEILCLKYHPLQDQLPKEDLLEALNIEFINTTNEVGVDINRAIAHPHTAQLVQFICGLGPRKAAALLRTLKKQQTPILESRTQLIMNCKFGAKVFINCAGFIKIDTAQLTDTGTDTYIEVLDSTRVHPEAYEWARKMAVDALEYDEDNDTNPASALEEILENPDKLKDLDLDAFAEELDKQGFGNKQITLYDIRTELTNRYKDHRVQFQTASAEELFQMLTRETPETLYEGKLVIGSVVRIARRQPDQDAYDNANPIRDEETSLWKCPFCSKSDFPELSDVWNHFDAKACPGEATGVHVRLDNGIMGFVKTDKLSDKSVNDPSERVQPGMTVHARVLRVIVDRFSVDLTCRSSDLNDVGFDYRAPKDENYDYEAERNDQDAMEESKKKQQRPTYIKRIIVHPAFHNIDFKKSEAMLREMDQGEAIIRPSSKGQDHLTLTWKVHTNINQHVDIVERGKDNAFSLGSQLFINNDAYEDLDEIIARYVQPMAGFARDLINFRYFRDADGGEKEAMAAMLEEEKRKQPGKIHYFVSASKAHPGKFILSYLPRNKVCVTRD